MKKKIDYRGYSITLTGEIGTCWDLWADSHDPMGETFAIPGICCEATSVEEVVELAKKVMDEDIEQNSVDEDD